MQANAKKSFKIYLQLLMGTVNQRVENLIEALGLNQNTFAIAIGVKSPIIHHIIKGRLNKPSFEVLEKISLAFANVNLDWLIKGEGEMFKKESIEQTESLEFYKPYTPDKQPVWEMPDPILIDTNNHEYIPITDIRAAAGTGIINDITIDEENTISLPSSFLGRGSGKVLCVRVRGQSMTPNIPDGSHAIIRYLDPSEWNTGVREGRVHVVSLAEEGTVIKRVKNRLVESDMLVLTSDNPDQVTYAPMYPKRSDIVSIWYVVCYISFSMKNIHEEYYAKLQSLEELVLDMQRQLQTKKLIS